MKKRLIKVLIIVGLGLCVIGAKECDKSDVITTLEITQNTLNFLYTGTVKPLVQEYCNAQGETDEHYDVCKEFIEVIDPAMEEFLGQTFPSLIKIAEIVIPEGTEPSDGDNITKAYIQMYVKLPAEQQAAIKAQILKTEP
jgi:hypothetical protein